MAVGFAEGIYGHNRRIKVEPFDLSVDQSALFDFDSFAAERDFVRLGTERIGTPSRYLRRTYEWKAPVSKRAFTDGPSISIVLITRLIDNL
jgi:hypothetical protein